MKFDGVITALVTPMHGSGVQFSALKAHVERQIGAGVAGVSPVGTTGESPTLDPKEHLDVVHAVIEHVQGRVPVYPGTGANATAEAVHLTKEADRMGAAGFLQVAPYYNKPSQEGLYRHFGTIAEVTDKPIILYSVPGRCGVEIGVETAARLYRGYPQVCVLKEASGNTDRVTALREACGEGFTVLSGDDSLTLPFLAAGARGVISVVANCLPELVVEMVRHALANDYAAAREVHDKLFAMSKAVLAVDSNPVPVKYVMAKAGQISYDTVRPPLAPLSEGGKAELDALMQRYRFEV